MDAFLRSQGSDDGGSFFLGKQYRWGRAVRADLQDGAGLGALLRARSLQSLQANLLGSCTT
jgi:hypothetical protein